MALPRAAKPAPKARSSAGAAAPPPPPSRPARAKRPKPARRGRTGGGTPAADDPARAAAWRQRVQAVAAWIAPPRTRRVAPSRAVLILVLNVAPFPGLGTAIYGHWERGLLQFALTFLFLVGWVWAVFDGFRILSASLRPPPALRPKRAP